MVRDGSRRWAMRSVSVGILLFMFGAGCGSEPVKPAKNDCTDMPSVPVIEKTAVARPCDQMIAVDSTMVCQSFSDGQKIVWQGEQLFPGSTGDLGRYCRYTWVDLASQPDPIWLTLPEIDDCTFVTPQSWPDTFDQWAHDEFVQSIAGEPAPSMDTNKPRTRVVVLDTSPDTNGAPDIEPGLTSNHGETLANMIKDLACGPDATYCPVQVKTKLVMPWRIDGETPTYVAGGGNIGRLGDVARGIWSEIELFRQELQNAADDLALDPANTARALAMPTRLVFNESFAFGGDRCDLAPINAPEDARALFKTFQAAACLGVAHVAAAGNHSGGESSSGLLCPALWDHAVAPTLNDCETLFGVDEFTAITTNFKKVTGAKYGIEQDVFNSNADALISVGAVDFSGVPIVMTRSNACPEAVALGVTGVDWNDSGTSESARSYLFGTSVSAAVVSAQIAAKWSQDGQQALYGYDIVQALSDNMNAHHFPLPTGGACEHLASEMCKDVPWIGKRPIGSGSLGELQNPLLSTAARSELVYRNDHITDLPEYVIENYQNDHAPMCTLRIPQCLTENAASAAANVSTSTAIVWPQPIDPVCLRCGIIFRGNDWVELWIDTNNHFAVEATAGRTVLRSAALVIGNAHGAIEMTIPLKPTAIVFNSVTKIEVPGTALEGRRVWISAYDDKGNSLSQQIFVNP